MIPKKGYDLRKRSVAPARGLTAGRLASVNKRQSEAVNNHVKRTKAIKAIVDSPGALQFPQNKKGRGL